MRSPNKILIVALDNLGDAVMASAVLGPINRIFPHAKVGLWVKQYAADLFVGQPHVDVVHGSDPFWDKSPGQKKGGFKSFFSVFREIRSARYDTAIVLNAEWRRALACRMAGIPQRIGYSRRKSAPFLTWTVPLASAPRHFADEHCDLIAQWSGQAIDASERRPNLETTDRDEQEWRNWSKQTGFADRGYTVLHLFSGDDAKNWPLERWNDLMEARSKSDASERFVLLLGPGEEQKMGAFRTKWPRAGVVLLVAPSLFLLKAVLAHARMVIGGDSGPGHVAAALGTPVLSLFGKTDPGRSGPRGRASTAFVQSAPLRDLSVAAVQSAINKFSLVYNRNQ